MDALRDLLFNGWGWLTVSIILFALEFIAPGVYFMFVGIAAFVLSLIVFVFPDFAVGYQLLVFSILAVISVLVGKKYIMEKETPSDDSTLNKRGSQYVGRECEVVQAFKNGKGRVRVEDTNWSATGAKDFAEGSTVRVVAVDGTRLQVEAVKTKK